MTLDPPGPDPQNGSILIKPTRQRAPVQVDLKGAIELYRQALSLGIVVHAEFVARQISAARPDDLEAQLPLLDAFTNTLRTDEAGPFVAELLDRFGQQPRLLKAAARYYQAAGAADLALQLLDEAGPLAPADPDIPWLIGVSRTALGAKAEAIAAFDAALNIAPDHVDAWFSRSLVIKGNDTPQSLAALEQLIADDQHRAPLKQAKLHLAAAWCHEGHDIDAQFMHLEKAGELFNSVFPWQEERARLQLEAITGFIDDRLVAAVKAAGNPEPAPIYIAAMPRSGTTLLEQILGTHSMTQPIGESQLFNHAISQAGFDLERSTAYWEWGQGEDFAPVLERFDRLYHVHARVREAGHKRIVDKSLDNYMTAGLILLTHPNARLIHLVRHPLDTILSMYQLYIEVGPNIPFTLEDLARHYQITQDYMAHWKRLFPERVLTVHYEALVTDPETEVRRILQFCDLRWEPACLEFYQRDAAVNTPSAMQVRQELHAGAIGRWKPYARHLRPAAEILGIEI